MEETTHTLAGNGCETVEIMVDTVDGEAVDVYTYADNLDHLPDELPDYTWTVGLNPLFVHVPRSDTPAVARIVSDLAIGSPAD